MDDSTSFPELAGLTPLPHLGPDGRQHPPVLAMAALGDSLVASLEVVGDAMRPDLGPGDLVVFTRHGGMPEDGGLYVIAAPAGLVVRRLQRMADGGVRAIPANPAYRDEVFDGSDGLVIVGMVVAVVRRCP